MAKADTNKSVGVAVIGAGMIAKTHLAALSGIKDKAQLKAIVSRHPERARPLAALYDGETPIFTSDLQSVADNPSIDMAVVITPPSVRHEIIEVLAKAGKHILLEKPVGRTLEEAKEVIEICERAGVYLGILFQHRMRASSLAAAQLIKNTDLGRLGLVEIAVPIWRDQSYYDELDRGTYARDGGGVMITNAIHSIDLALSLAGPITSVQAMTATTCLHKMEAEDFAVSGLKFACGASGSFVASTAMFPHRTEIIRLHFEKASLKIDKSGLEIDWHNGRNEITGQTLAKQGENPLLGGKHEWHQAVMEDFISAIKTGGKPMVTGQEALISHRLIKAIEQSSKLGRAIDIIQ